MQRATDKLRATSLGTTWTSTSLAFFVKVYVENPVCLCETGRGFSTMTLTSENWDRLDATSPLLPYVLWACVVLHPTDTRTL